MLFWLFFVFQGLKKASEEKHKKFLLHGKGNLIYLKETNKKHIFNESESEEKKLQQKKN